MNEKPMHYHRTYAHNLFCCRDCGVELERSETEPGILVHPPDGGGLIWKKNPAECEFVGRIVKDPDAYVG
jgi:hypothetical protein